MLKTLNDALFNECKESVNLSKFAIRNEVLNSTLFKI